MLFDSRQVFTGKKFSVLTGYVEGRSGRVAREVVIHPGAVVILPLTEDREILLIRNQRFAVEKTLWELPAGTLEPEEKPEHTALRELEEETGYRAKNLEYFCRFYTSPGFCNEVIYSFLATDLHHVGQRLDDNEFITVELFSQEQVRHMIEKGEIEDAKTLTTLLRYFVYSENNFH